MLVPSVLDIGLGMGETGADETCGNGVGLNPTGGGGGCRRFGEGRCEAVPRI